MDNVRKLTLKNFRRGPSSEGLEQLYDSYKEPLERYFCGRLPADEDAEDHVHQLFARLIEVEDLPSIQKRSDHIRNLVFRMARNLVIDRLRARGARAADRHERLDDVSLAFEGPQADQVVASKQTLAKFTEHLYQLPPKCRQVFLLHRVQCLSQQEVSVRLGISVSTVEKHMIKAIRLLRQKREQLS